MLMAACVPVYLSLLDASLWTDEAWVANSVLTSSVGQMLYYDDWMQSTPPLVLLGMRASVALFGVNELAFRLVPLVGGLISLLLTGILLQRIFSLPLALLGTTFQGLNYWAFKYAQQSKQYSIDLLVSSGFLFLLWSVNESGYSRTRYLGLLAFGCIAPFLSHPTVFWLPAAILALALDRHCERRFQMALTATAFWGAAVGVNYFVFILPNSSERMFHLWTDGMLLTQGLGGGLMELASSLRTLLLPPIVPALTWASGLLLLLVLVGLVYGVANFRNSRGGAFAVLGGGMPLLTAMVVNMAGYYPLLGYPRVILWFLPSAVLLLCFGLRTVPVWKQIPATPVALVCIAAALAAPWIVDRVRPTEEENRAALTYLRAAAGPDDQIYVHGGLWAQFAIYEQILDWRPAHSYIGGWGWPCCALDVESKASFAAAETDAQEVASFLESAEGRVWLLAPAALDGHWSSVLRDRLAEQRDEFGAMGCVVEETHGFGHTRLEGFTC